MMKKIFWASVSLLVASTIGCGADSGAEPIADPYLTTSAECPGGTCIPGAQCITYSGRDLVYGVVDAAGVCCYGCIDNVSGMCHEGTALAACGVGGEVCQKCSTIGLACDPATCSEGVCGNTPLPQGTTCGTTRGYACDGVQCCNVDHSSCF